VPVLVGAARFEDSSSQGVAFVLDLTERKRAEDSLRQAQAELSHVTRMTTLGELAASIAHEVNQPLSGIVSNGSACLRWLGGDAPDLNEIRDAVRDIVRDGKRAAEVIARIRALATKSTAPPREKLDLNEQSGKSSRLSGMRRGERAW
jgi:C4-dicarboxylate-specific signal transduction histidine kinase